MDDKASVADRQSLAAESSDDEELDRRIQLKKVEFERKMHELEQRDDGEQNTFVKKIQEISKRLAFSDCF